MFRNMLEREISVDKDLCDDEDGLVSLCKTSVL